MREEVESGMGEVMGAQKRLEEVYAAYAEPDADFDALAEEQARLEAIISAGAGDNVEHQLELAADALRLPPWDAKSAPCPAVKSAAWRCANCCCPNPTCCCWTNRPTTWTPNRWNGWSSSSAASLAPWWPSLTIVTSWTTPPNGFWSSTVAKASPGRQLLQLAGAKETRLEQEAKSEVARMKAMKQELEWVRQTRKAVRPNPRRGLPALKNCPASSTKSATKPRKSSSRWPSVWAMQVIEFENVSKGFGDRLLIDNLSFKGPAGRHRRHHRPQRRR